MHLDGARVFNAATALGVPVSAITANVTSVQLCLSKASCRDASTPGVQNELTPQAWLIDESSDRGWPPPTRCPCQPPYSMSGLSWLALAGFGGAGGVHSGRAQGLHRHGVPLQKDAGRRHASVRRFSRPRCVLGRSTLLQSVAQNLHRQGALLCQTPDSLPVASVNKAWGGAWERIGKQGRQWWLFLCRPDIVDGGESAARRRPRQCASPSGGSGQDPADQHRRGRRAQQHCCLLAQVESYPPASVLP